MAKTPDSPLRVIGTSVTLSSEVQSRIRADLGFAIEFDVLDGSACLRRGVTRPDSFDIYDQWFHSVDVLHTAGSIMPIEVDRIDRWHQMAPMYRGAGLASGAPGRRQCVGRDPADVLFVQADNGLGREPTHQVSMLPTVCNADGFAYRRELAANRSGPESWGWLLEQNWGARCMLSQDPASSVTEVAMAARSAGLVEIADCTNLTIEEIDALFVLLNRRRKAGHFTRTWPTHEESVRLMAQPSTGLGSLWSPAYFELCASGVDLVYATPIEGYRGWHSGLCLSAALESAMCDRAYAYLNWWLSGAPGAILARQGYYMSVTEPLRDVLTPAEWAYWYEGKPATTPLPGPDGRISVNIGDRRAGGSYQDRMSAISFWSTIMEESNYLQRKWLEFVG
ncbi:extracellular solute-binding protein [Rhodobacteraceae bacterium F11138]|nr:extracellular solute-binding protein [Rhodobacteraceae bacterium F11138]